MGYLPDKLPYSFENEHGFRRIYEHWILGKGAEEKPPRWSVIRNVLHWVK